MTSIDDLKRKPAVTDLEYCIIFSDLHGLPEHISAEQAAAELAQLRADLEYIVGQNKIFLDGMNRYRAELDDWEEAKKFVANDCKDEIHCGCVPILRRELDEAKEFTKILLARIDALQKPIDVTNVVDGYSQLRAELDAKTKAVDEARKLLTIAEWAKFDKAVLRHYCMFCDHLMSEHYPECELSAWLTAHPKEEE